MKQPIPHAPRTHFEKPTVEIILLDRVDILTTSGGLGDPIPDENWGEWDARPYSN